MSIFLDTHIQRVVLSCEIFKERTKVTETAVTKRYVTRVTRPYIYIYGLVTE
jgi:hypothetical protein